LDFAVAPGTDLALPSIQTEWEVADMETMLLDLVTDPTFPQIVMLLGVALALRAIHVLLS
jgi:hypothetical protein